MSQRSKNEFIQNLSQKLEPINVNWSAEKRTAIWVLFNLSFTLFLMHLIGDFSLSSHLQGWRLAEFIIGLISILTLSYCAFLGIVPGATTKKVLKLGLIPLSGFITLFFIALFAHLEPTAPGVYRWHCDLEILALSLVPGLQFGYFLFKDMLFSQKLSFVMGGMVSALIPAFYMNYVCPFNATHTLVFHLGPVAIFATIFSLILFKQRANKANA